MRLKSAQTAEMARKRPEIRFSLQKTVRFGRINVETNPAAFAFYGVPLFFRLAPFNQRFPNLTAHVRFLELRYVSEMKKDERYEKALLAAEQLLESRKRAKSCFYSITCADLTQSQSTCLTATRGSPLCRR
ncbi:MAG: hypothetical protein WC997_13515 [Porticoccaceae bacterium]